MKKYSALLRKTLTHIDAIKARRWKMVRHALRYPEEIHNIILEFK